MHSRFGGLIHFGLAVSLVLAACTDRGVGRSEAEVVVTDDNQTAVSLPRPAKRVIALMPAASEIVRSLGHDSALIARVEEDTAPGMHTVPSVGRVLEPSVEMVVRFEPDLVIAWADARELIARLRKSGITVYAARFERLDASASHVARIGRLLGAADRADSLANSITSDLATLRAMSSTSHRPTVLYVLESEPLWTAGPGTFIDDVIDVAGGRNVFHDLPTKWGEVSVEAVVARQPDVIVVARPPGASDSAALLVQPGWRGLQAVRTGRVHFIDSNQFNRPGPSVVRTARELRRIVHPQND